MNSTTTEQVREVSRRWADAEQRHDADALDPLLTEDCTLVGPLGFVLDKAQMLDRFRSGALVYRSLEWAEDAVRAYGDAAVSVGCVTQHAAYQGHPADGRFRVTQVAVRDGDRWQLAALHYSPVVERP